MVEQLDLFSWSQEPAEIHAAAEREPNEPKQERCEGCRYDRPMTAWGETFQACHYRIDTGDAHDLYTTDDDGCSGYDDGLRRGPDGARLNGMYYESSAGRLVSYVLGREYWRGPLDGQRYPAEWQKWIKAQRAIE